jgi:hypothetical protein
LVALYLTCILFMYFTITVILDDFLLSIISAKIWIPTETTHIHTALLQNNTSIICAAEKYLFIYMYIVVYVEKKLI